MIINSTEDLADFTVKKFGESGLSRDYLCSELKKTKQAIGHAFSRGERSNPGRNGIRREILKLLGYSVGDAFIVEKLQKK